MFGSERDGARMSRRGDGDPMRGNGDGGDGAKGAGKSRRKSGLVKRGGRGRLGGTLMY